MASIAPTTTPYLAYFTEIFFAGESVICIPAGIDGGVISNPPGAIGRLYVDPTKPAPLQENGTTFALEPGESWPVIGGQTSPTYVNANNTNHKFSAIFWQSTPPAPPPPPPPPPPGPVLDLTDPKALPFVPTLLTGI